MTQTAVAAFDELFKAHFVFAVSYDEALCNFYTFIQTTVYGIDVGTAKESPRVKEIRVRIQNRAIPQFRPNCKDNSLQNQSSWRKPLSSG